MFLPTHSLKLTHTHKHSFNSLPHSLPHFLISRVGLFLRKSRKWKEAHAAFNNSLICAGGVEEKRAQKHKPRETETGALAYLNIAIIQLREKALEEAEGTLYKGLGLAPNIPAIHVQLATAKRKAGNVLQIFK